jgi:hypothetical protein
MHITGGSAEDLYASLPASAGREQKIEVATHMTFNDDGTGAHPADAATFGTKCAALDGGMEGTTESWAAIAELWVSPVSKKDACRRLSGTSGDSGGNGPPCAGGHEAVVTGGRGEGCKKG